MWKEGEGHTSHWLYRVGKVEAGSALCRAVRCRLNGRAVTPTASAEPRIHNLRPAREPRVLLLVLLLSLSCCPQIPALLTSERPLHISTPRSCADETAFCSLGCRPSPPSPACPWSQLSASCCSPPSGVDAK